MTRARVPRTKLVPAGVHVWAFGKRGRMNRQPVTCSHHLCDDPRYRIFVLGSYTARGALLIAYKGRWQIYLRKLIIFVVQSN